MAPPMFLESELPKIHAIKADKGPEKNE